MNPRPRYLVLVDGRERAAFDSHFEARKCAEALHQESPSRNVSAIVVYNPTLHWDQFNPWRDSIVYVPIERLAECVAGGMIAIGGWDGPQVPHDVAYVLKRFAQGGDKLDAYILPQPSGDHDLGVRYGAEGSEYFSPHNAHPARTQALLEEFRR